MKNLVKIIWAILRAIAKEKTCCENGVDSRYSREISNLTTNSH